MHNAIHFLQIASLLYRHNISDRQQMSLAAEVYGFLSAEVHARHVPRHSNQLHGRYLCL